MKTLRATVRFFLGKFKMSSRVPGRVCSSWICNLKTSCLARDSGKPCCLRAELREMKQLQEQMMENEIEVAHRINGLETRLVASESQNAELKQRLEESEKRCRDLEDTLRSASRVMHSIGVQSNDSHSDDPHDSTTIHQ
ncbi:Laminin subunit alpha-2 [Frankliniella fusca]|uniref:Laminin subunit alpha-2 n=1 Tax=Frankliniella fusca TaxID=407009 RepID=A0AAE1GXW1_9NEOP|nr:Laminin subunit alpha-2 [Frankliniella fusca]